MNLVIVLEADGLKAIEAIRRLMASAGTAPRAVPGADGGARGGCTTSCSGGRNERRGAGGGGGDRRGAGTRIRHAAERVETGITRAHTRWPYVAYELRARQT